MDSYGAWGRPARAATRPIRKNEPHFRVFRCFSSLRVALRCLLSGVRERPIMPILLCCGASGDALRGCVARGRRIAVGTGASRSPRPTEGIRVAKKKPPRGRPSSSRRLGLVGDTVAGWFQLSGFRRLHVAISALIGVAGSPYVALVVPRKQPTLESDKRLQEASKRCREGSE